MGRSGERPPRIRPLLQRVLSLVGLRLAQDDLGAVQRQIVELEEEAFAVAVVPGSA